MDRRRENRLKPKQIATVTVLGLRPGPTLLVNVLDLSGSGMRVLSKLPVPCGSLVKVEVNGTEVSGSVVRCEPEENIYELGIQVSNTTAKSEI